MLAASRRRLMRITSRLRRWRRCSRPIGMRLSAMKLAGDPHGPARFKDDATADELRAGVMRHIARLSVAGVVDLTALPVPVLE